MTILGFLWWIWREWKKPAVRFLEALTILCAFAINCVYIWRSILHNKESAESPQGHEGLSLQDLFQPFVASTILLLVTLVTAGFKFWMSCKERPGLDRWDKEESILNIFKKFISKEKKEVSKGIFSEFLEGYCVKIFSEDIRASIYEYTYDDENKELSIETLAEYKPNNRNRINIEESDGSGLNEVRKRELIDCIINNRSYVCENYYNYMLKEKEEAVGNSRGGRLKNRLKNRLNKTYKKEYKDKNVGSFFRGLLVVSDGGKSSHGLILIMDHRKKRYFIQDIHDIAYFTHLRNAMDIIYTLWKTENKERSGANRGNPFG